MNHDFQIGDYARHPSYPGWIWKLIVTHNNPRVGCWRLALKLKGAKWPRPHGIPEEGEVREIGYSTLDHLNEMEVLALAAL